jgi:uncharacterized membrane protein
MSIAKGLRNYFLRGLAVLLPTILTIWILAWGYSFIQDNISVYINWGLVRLTMLVKGLDWHDESIRKVWSDFWVDGWGSIAGFIIAVVAVCIVGAILASVVGRAIWRMIEGFIMNTPLLRRVYPYVKQITDFLLTQDKKKELFSRVVAVEYPRKGSWSIGFVTGSGLKRVVDNIEKEFLTILIPNSPMPVTGYVIMVPKEQTIALDMTVEEAFRFTISAGVIAPSGQQVAALPKADLKNKEER